MTVLAEEEIKSTDAPKERKEIVEKSFYQSVKEAVARILDSIRDTFRKIYHWAAGKLSSKACDSDV